MDGGRKRGAGHQDHRGDHQPLAQVGPAGVKVSEYRVRSLHTQRCRHRSQFHHGRHSVGRDLFRRVHHAHVHRAPMLHVGPSEISYNAGVFASNGHQSEVEAAAATGKPIDTLSLNFGFYLSAQGAGIAVLNGVINHAVQVEPDGRNRRRDGAGHGHGAHSGALRDELHQRARRIVRGHHQQERHAAPGDGPRQRRGGQRAVSPAVRHCRRSQHGEHLDRARIRLSIQTASSANPITVPPYSVLRADLTAPPVAAIVNSASFQPGPVAPQQLVTAFGSGFASTDHHRFRYQPLPPTLGDTAIAITDSKGTIERGSSVLRVSRPGQLSDPQRGRRREPRP